MFTRPVKLFLLLVKKKNGMIMTCFMATLLGLRDSKTALDEKGDHGHALRLAFTNDYALVKNSFKFSPLINILSTVICSSRVLRSFK